MTQPWRLHFRYQASARAVNRAVITASGTAGNVVGLAYVAAFAPDEGEDLGTLQSNFPPPAAGPNIRFCADLPDAEAAFMAISQRPLSGVAFGEKARPRPGARARPGPGASHVVMLSRPAVVADVVREAVRSCAQP